MYVRVESINDVERRTLLLLKYLELYKTKGGYDEFEDSGDFNLMKKTAENILNDLPKSGEMRIRQVLHYSVDISKINGWLQQIAGVLVYLVAEMERHPLKFYDEKTWRFIAGDLMGSIYEALLSFGFGCEDMESIRLRFVLVKNGFFG